MNQSIIVLGGMGPQASVQLHTLLNEGSSAFHDGANEDFPRILHASIPVPDFIESQDNFKVAVQIVSDVCDELPLHSATAIGLACNTAHLMVDKLPLAGTNFVSMIDAVVDRLRSMGVSKVGLLASPQTVKTGLYSKALRQKDIDALTLGSDGLGQTEAVIRRVIGGDDPAAERSLLTGLADQLVDQGAQVILLGCTELPLVGVDVNVPVVNSLQVLADALLEKHYQRNV